MQEFSSKCVVVAYDKVRGYLNWNQAWFKEEAKKCRIPVKFSEDASKANRANIVLFHAPSHRKGAPSNLRKTFPNKIFALISLEQPKYAPILNDYNYISKNFDFTITYLLSEKYESTQVINLPVTYYPLNIFQPSMLLKDPTPFIKKSVKGVSVVLFTSNCKNAGAEGRYDYIKELMKYIKVHSYGGCLNNIKEPQDNVQPLGPYISPRRNRKISILSKYKFYLAFENLDIPDYVSEKIFDAYFAGTLPIYRGTKSIDKFLPSNNSFINANEKSPKELADMLKSLDQNQDEYNKYFEFKKYPLKEEFIRITKMSYMHPNVLCRMCELAHVIKKNETIEVSKII